MWRTGEMGKGDLKYTAVNHKDTKAQTVAALYEGVNKSQERVFPSSKRRGGCAIKKMLRSLLVKAQTGWSVPDNVTTSTFTIMTTRLRRFGGFASFSYWRSHPLLFQEGNALSWQFI